MRVIVQAVLEGMQGPQALLPGRPARASATSIVELGTGNGNVARRLAEMVCGKRMSNATTGTRPVVMAAVRRACSTTTSVPSATIAQVSWPVEIARARPTESVAET